MQFANRLAHFINDGHVPFEVIRTSVISLAKHSPSGPDGLNVRCIRIVENGSIVVRVLSAVVYMEEVAWHGVPP